MEQFYRQRALIEKEYGTKLQQLCSESFKKKAKISASVSVGDEPSVTPGSLENSSLVVWNEILNQTENIAKDRLKLSGDFNSQMADKVGLFQRISESLQKKYQDLHNVVTKERDTAFNDLKKAKLTYDSSCQDMEHIRVKAEKASSSSSKQKKLTEKETKMNVVKNSYVIKINQTNRLKDKYYYQDLPEILDGIQDLNEFKVTELNKYWNNAITLETELNKSVNTHLDSLVGIIGKNTFNLDTIMYIKHNIEPWKEPLDFYYEPSPIWHDDEKIVTKALELQDLKARLQVANKAYQDNDATCEKLQETISNLNREKLEMKKGVAKDKTMSHYVDESVHSLKRFIIDDNKRVAAEVEMQTIQTSVGDRDMTVNEPIQTKKKSRLGFLKGNGRAETTTSFRSLSISSHASHGSSSSPEGLASYNYLATAEDEISISAGEKFEIVQADDGSGWTNIRRNDGSTGLVPTSYIVVSKKTPPKVAAPRKKSGKKLPQAKVLYAYVADGADEMTLEPGDVVTIVQHDDGSGWTLGETNGNKGLFPTSYVQML